MKPTAIPHAKPPSTNDQLCFTCNGMLVRPHHEIGLFDKFEERSGADISKSIEAGCRLCTMFGEVLKARQLPLSHATITITLRLATINEMDFKVKQGMRADTMEKYSRINYLVQGCTGNNGSEKIDILLVPTDDQPVNWPPAPVRKLPDFPLSLSTNSNSSFDFIKNWSYFCRNYHEACNGNQGLEIWLPTRLVDVSDTDSQRPRVVVTASDHVEGCEYLCLSHRWIDMTLKLQSTNIDELRKEIPIDEVSQTFRDAFIATRQLGFRYIWVDSLCIMQDHQREEGWQDWLTESARMGENYKNAALTIAPTPTVDKADEFFSTRDTPDRTPLTVRIERKFCKDMSTTRCGNIQVDVSGRYCCFSEDLWLSRIDRAPLNRRGWVYQERLLSPRTVHFGTEVFWECRMKTASEMLPMGFPLSSTARPLNENTKCWVDEVRSTSKFLDVYGRWMNFVENFSHCHLTMERDKLPAIAGVAAVVQLPDDQYLAGLWRSGLASQLIWRRSEKRWADYELPRDYRAPSWSWASVNGPIEFLASEFYIDRKSRYTAAIIDSKVDLLVARHPLGQVTGAQLCLRVDLAHISPQRIAANPDWILTLDDKAYDTIFAVHHEHDLDKWQKFMTKVPSGKKV
ncbi:hypothetical protein FOWG_14387 [Fusarium oxysporum f. sp. lycopersici MN25]|nr:hypothetical protein FOWG_14387 [Fusarium oxysporum f. sp. lycopersici MN25]